MNGFFTPEMDFIPLQARSEVFTQPVQALLGDLHHRAGISCGCRFPHLAGLPLEVIKQPDGRYRLDRRSITDPHHEDCVFRLPEDFEAQPPAADLVFEVSGRREASAPAFRHVARHLLSASHSILFARSLADPAHRPSVAEFLAEIGRRAQGVQAYPFYSLQAAAAERGLALTFGFLCPPPDHVPDDTVAPMVFEAWSQAKGAMTAMLVPVGDWAWVDAWASLRMLGRCCAGPYFYVAATDRTGLVVKLALLPIYLDAVNVVPVDSHTERKRVSQLVETGALLYKPVRMDHYREVVRRVGRRLGVTMTIPQFRADFIYLQGGTMVVEEVRGFAPGRLLDYDVHFDRKTLRAASDSCPNLRHSVCDGWLLPEPKSVSCPYREGGLPIQVLLDSSCVEISLDAPSEHSGDCGSMDGGKAQQTNTVLDDPPK
jgi:hypothetical protein